MKKFFAGLLLFLFAATGCANHYYRKSGDRLQFFLKNPDAGQVAFACSTDGFQLHAAEQIGSATWMVSLPDATEFSYFYMIDGKVYLPPCPLTETDDFGFENCVFSSDM